MSGNRGATVAAAPTMFVPLDLIAKCRGARMTCLLDDGSEVEGVMAAHDSTCTVVLQNAVAYDVEWRRASPSSAGAAASAAPTELVAHRQETGRFKQMVVSSRRIRVLVPGGVPAA